VTSGDSYARASLASGELGVRANSVYFGNAGASAGFDETLNFTVAGAAADAVTPITVLLKWHGKVAPGVSPDSGGATAFYQFDLFQGIFNATVRVDANAQTGRENDYMTQVVGNWLSSSVDGEEDDDTQIFSLTYGLKGAAPSILLRASMGATSTLTGSADALNTAAINFILPGNVTFTSTSGAFLSQAQPILGGAVPEPATWAMMLSGFGLAGVVLRRRPVASGVTRSKLKPFRSSSSTKTSINWTGFSSET